jgi:hypothetical protein
MSKSTGRVTSTARAENNKHTGETSGDAAAETENPGGKGRAQPRSPLPVEIIERGLRRKRPLTRDEALAFEAWWNETLTVLASSPRWLLKRLDPEPADYLAAELNSVVDALLAAVDDIPGGAPTSLFAAVARLEDLQAWATAHRTRPAGSGAEPAVASRLAAHRALLLLAGRDLVRLGLTPFALPLETAVKLATAAAEAALPKDAPATPSGRRKDAPTAKAIRDQLRAMLAEQSVKVPG